MKAGVRNKFTTLGFTVFLGAFAGLVIWCFLKMVGICTVFVWEKIPNVLGNRWIVVGLCAAGGLCVGILRKLFGDYPEELNVVMGKIKKDKYYDYHPMLVMLLCAFFPLVFGASVGPEAGLTGIIAALCYWVGDNVTFAKKNADVYSEVGEAVTLGQLFRSPLFGILAVVEGESENTGEKADSKSLTRIEKLLYYGLSTAASFFVIKELNTFFGKAMSGFPSFEEVIISRIDYVMLLIYIPLGIVLFVFFEKCERLSHAIAKRVPAVVKETICGIIIGVMGVFVPMVLFSGEEQMADLMDGKVICAPLFLIGICLLKLVMTTFCISFGMKGGHFFPVIFAGTCMGYGLAGLIFADPAPHVVFAAGVITAAMLGAQLKKPLAVAVLLLLCFPARFVFWLFLAAAAGAGAAKLFRGHGTSV